MNKSLSNLKAHLLKEAHVVQSMVTSSIEGLLNNDAEALIRVMEIHEPKVNDFDRAIDEMGIEYIAKFDPLARDLRTVIMIIKMNKDLERIADHAVLISASGKMILSHSYKSNGTLFQPLFDHAVKILGDSIDAFNEEDVVLAQKICQQEYATRALEKEIDHQITNQMHEHPDSIPLSIEMLRISQHLKRVIELSTNIAEDVIYMIEGKDMKHTHSR